LLQIEACCSPLVREPLTKDWAQDLSRMFRALGDPVRLRLLSLVASHAGGEACVCEISPAFDLSQPTISHHLKVLREAGLLECERRGTWVYYWVVPSALSHFRRSWAPWMWAPPRLARARHRFWRERANDRSVRQRRRRR